MHISLWLIALRVLPDERLFSDKPQVFDKVYAIAAFRFR